MPRIDIINSESISEILGEDGPFADVLTGFRPREQQQHLAEAVQEALDAGGQLIGEAGTGTGKTFAYLVPAILSGQRVVISTGTRHLQDQLYHNDLPLVKRALGEGVSTSLLKGRANYLCRHRLELALRNPAIREPEQRAQLNAISDWSRETESGDIAEVLTVPEGAPIWQYVVSNEDVCSQHDPDDLDDCLVTRARKRAQQADIVVVNHHLLCADLALKESGFGEILPSANAFIIDEAHQLPDIAAQFFGQRLSSRQLFDLARDTRIEQKVDASDNPALADMADALEKAVRYFRLAFPLDPERGSLDEMREPGKLDRELDSLADALAALHAELGDMAERGKGLESCHRRAAAQMEALKLLDVRRGNVDNPAGEGEGGPRDEYIHWYETFRSGFNLNMTPLSVARPFQRAMTSLPAAWVFTSATLAVAGDFTHFRDQLGLADSARMVQVDSPFDYRRNALLYLPKHLPEPRERHYTQAVLDATIPVLEASGGRAFLLFTSHRALQEAATVLADRLDWPLLVQGQMPKRELIEAFQSVGNAILLGTGSFWEGVDVRGDALSLVVIDKLPFGSPGDPVLNARIRHLKANGGDPFVTWQIPQAAIALKQGVGRLIRDVTDTGVLMLCDPRIRGRDYGELFIGSLPAMPITRDLDEVEAFFARDTDALELEVSSS